MLHEITVIHQVDFVAYPDAERALGLLEAFYPEESQAGIASAKFPLNHVCLRPKSPNQDPEKSSDCRQATVS
jgi:hypothetical protein